MVETDFIRASHAHKVEAEDIEAYLKPYVDPLYSESFPLHPQVDAASCGPRRPMCAVTCTRRHET